MVRRANGVKYPRAEYKIARDESQYAEIQRFLKGTEFERVSITFPTVMAYRNGKLLGVLGTRPSDQAVIAGPLHVSVEPPQGAFLALRLIEAYDVTLKGMGIIMYVFSVRKGNKKQLDILNRAGFTPYAEKAGYKWFKRYI